MVSLILVIGIIADIILRVLEKKIPYVEDVCDIDDFHPCFKLRVGVESIVIIPCVLILITVLIILGLGPEIIVEEVINVAKRLLYFG